MLVTNVLALLYYRISCSFSHTIHLSTHLVEFLQQCPPKQVEGQTKQQAHAGTIRDVDSSWGGEGVHQAGQGRSTAPADHLLGQTVLSVRQTPRHTKTHHISVTWVRGARRGTTWLMSAGEKFNDMRKERSGGGCWEDNSRQTDDKEG